VTDTRPLHLALVGPTASGKSAIAMEIAHECGDVEVVSLDSMQVYRGMDIGTAKPTPEDQRAVPHHLVDVTDPSDDWSVARTQAVARAAVADIESRGRRALLVGGTGLYVRAVVDDLSIPGQDLAVRAELEARTEAPGALADAYRQLQSLDPAAAARIEPNNRRRIVRALEVIEITGRPFSSFGPGVQHARTTAFPVLLAGIWLPRDVVAQRIAARVDRMRADGFLDEVRRLAGMTLSRTAQQAIGYRELLAHVRGDGSTIDDTFERVVRRTRAFARRQRMWFRRDHRVMWLGRSGDDRESARLVRRCWDDLGPTIELRHRDVS
jgi:tRNA dimethylallyltransferase